jgi:hypothetical protein
VRAFAISLAVASIVSTNDAVGQVRSTIQARARVVEAGPGWLASGTIREVLATARSLSHADEISFDQVLSIGHVVSIESGGDLSGTPVPRLSFFMTTSTMSAALRSFRRRDGYDPNGCAAVAGRSTICSLFPKVSNVAFDGVSFGATTQPDEPPRLIVYVEHIAN